MKKGFARRAIAATVALGMGMTLAACSGGGSGGGSGSSVQGGTYKGPKVTVTFWNGWTGGDQQTILTKLVSEFNSSHKNIVIKPVEMQWADISAKMPLAIKAGKGPDLTVAHGDDIATYAAQGLLVKSDAIVKELGYKASDFPPGLFEHGVYQGAQYGIPWSVTPLGLYVNKSRAAEGGHQPDRHPGRQDHVPRRPAEAEGQGHPGRVGGRLRLHRHVRVRVAALAVRRRPVQQGRLEGHVQLAGGRRRPHLDGRPGQEGLQPRARSRRTATSTPSSPARPRSTGTASGRPATRPC